MSVCEESISRVLFFHLLQTFFIFFAMTPHLGCDGPYKCVSDLVVVCCMHPWRMATTGRRTTLIIAIVRSPWRTRIPRPTSRGVGTAARAFIAPAVPGAGAGPTPFWHWARRAGSLGD